MAASLHQGHVSNLLLTVEAPSITFLTFFKWTFRNVSVNITKWNFHSSLPMASGHSGIISVNPEDFSDWIFFFSLWNWTAQSFFSCRPGGTAVNMLLIPLLSCPGTGEQCPPQQTPLPALQLHPSSSCPVLKASPTFLPLHHYLESLF